MTRGIVMGIKGELLIVLVNWDLELEVDTISDFIWIRKNSA